MKCFILFPRDIFGKYICLLATRGYTMPMTHKNELFQLMAFFFFRKFDNFSCFETRYLLQRRTIFSLQTSEQNPNDKPCILSFTT